MLENAVKPTGSSVGPEKHKMHLMKESFMHKSVLAWELENLNSLWSQTVSYYRTRLYFSFVFPFLFDSFRILFRVPSLCIQISLVPVFSEVSNEHDIIQIVLNIALLYSMHYSLSKIRLTMISPKDLCHDDDSRSHLMVITFITNCA